jgi:hypothetical protein
MIVTTVLSHLTMADVIVVLDFYRLRFVSSLFGILFVSF